MKQKIKDIVQNDKRLVIISITGLAITIAMTVCVCVTYNHYRSKGMQETDLSKIDVSNEEIQLYRERIGSDMDVKKAIFILFNTEDDCRSFIAEHGADENPLDSGIGIVPLMQDGYYNIVGKGSLEAVFDSLQDGEYTTEPIAYSNLYCYMKRIGIESPTEDDEKLKELIRHDKYQETKREGD